MTDLELNQDANEEAAVVADVAEVKVEDVVEAPEVVAAPEPVVAQEVISAPEPAEEKPGIVPVGNGVIGSGKVKREPVAKKEPKVEAPVVEKVAVLSSRNLVWQGVGKLVKGYNFVSKEDAAKWLTLDTVREASPQEVKATLG